MREALAGLGVLVLLGAAYPLSQATRRLVADAPAGLTQEQSAALEEKAQASLFGQFRGSMSDFLYLQVDRYVHGGVELRGMTDREKTARQERVTSADGVEAGVRQHSGTETTVVPDRAHDWRGVLGDIDRHIKPYAPMAGHRHKDPREALQIYRLMAASNPRSVRAYTEGAWAMVTAQGEGPHAALKFLVQGARNNPESVEIAASLGWLLTRVLERYEDGRLVLEHSIQVMDARDPATLTSEEKEALQSVFRYLVNNRKDAGDRVGGRRWAVEGLRRYPDDVSCKKFLRDDAAAKQE